MPRILTFKNELTLSQVSDGLNDLGDAIRKGDEVIVDVMDVQKVDVAAIQMLIAAQKECENNGCRMVINKSDSVVNLLSLIGAQL